MCSSGLEDCSRICWMIKLCVSSNEEYLCNFQSRAPFPPEMLQESPINLVSCRLPTPVHVRILMGWMWHCFVLAMLCEGLRLEKLRVQCLLKESWIASSRNQMKASIFDEYADVLDDAAAYSQPITKPWA